MDSQLTSSNSRLASERQARDLNAHAHEEMRHSEESCILGSQPLCRAIPGPLHKRPLHLQTVACILRDSLSLSPLRVKDSPQGSPLFLPNCSNCPWSPSNRCRLPFNRLRLPFGFLAIQDRPGNQRGGSCAPPFPVSARESRICWGYQHQKHTTPPQYLAASLYAWPLPKFCPVALPYPPQPAFLLYCSLCPLLPLPSPRLSSVPLRSPVRDIAPPPLLLTSNVSSILVIQHSTNA